MDDCMYYGNPEQARSFSIGTSYLESQYAFKFNSKS